MFSRFKFYESAFWRIPFRGIKFREFYLELFLLFKLNFRSFSAVHKKNKTF